MELRRMLGAWSEIQVVAEADALLPARALLQRNDYELVFVDAGFVGGEGFDLIASIRRGARAIVVASTDVHARRAFDMNALDYLLKPIDPARLAIALRRVGVLAFEAGDSTSPWSKSRPSGIILSDIAAIRSHENYSIVHLIDGGRSMVRKTLKAWIEILPASHFVQVHRSAVVNLARVAAPRRHGSKSFSVQVMGIAEPMPVGRGFWLTLNERLRRRR